MDPISHAVLGAALAQPAAVRRNEILPATAVGVIAAMVPDVDVLIRSSQDPLLALEYHRHFTHSLAFVPFGSLLCALLLAPLFRTRLTFARCYLFCCLGMVSHGLLDACTSYGTHLLWPFSGLRVTWDIVSAIDPLVTLPLIAGVAYGAWRRRPIFAVAGMAWCLAYLGLGLAQNIRVTGIAGDLAASRGHAPRSIEVKPSLGNIVLWRTFYEQDGRYYVDAVRAGPEATVIAGERLVKLDPARDFPWLDPRQEQWRDIERFSRFTGGYLALDPVETNRIVDMRYSLVPNRGGGLWGIVLDPDASTESHAAYVTMRLRPTSEGRELLRMLLQGDSGE